MCVLPICQLALESRRIPLEDVEFGLLNDVSKLLEVFTAAATAFRATVHTFGKAFAV
jgi:hypothetical protein